MKKAKNDKVNICMVGTGYVGLVSGACLAELGHNVVCVDNDPSKIKMLEKGIMPIYEDDLERVVSKNVKAGRLHFANSIKEGMHHKGRRAEAIAQFKEALRLQPVYPEAEQQLRALTAPR